MAIGGMIATIGMFLLALGAFPVLRKKHYNIFAFTHWLGLAALILGVSLQIL